MHKCRSILRLFHCIDFTFRRISGRLLISATQSIWSATFFQISMLPVRAAFANNPVRWASFSTISNESNWEGTANGVAFIINFPIDEPVNVFSWGDFAWVSLSLNNGGRGAQCDHHGIYTRFSTRILGLTSGRPFRSSSSKHPITSSTMVRSLLSTAADNTMQDVPSCHASSHSACD